MNLETVLAILKEIAMIIQALRDMGVKVDGHVNLTDILPLLKRP